MILPQHSDVANAIGAVVGRITRRVQGSITAPSEGQFRAHLDGPKDFKNEEQALDCLERCSQAIDQALDSVYDIVTKVSELKQKPRLARRS